MLRFLFYVCIAHTSQIRGIKDINIDEGRAEHLNVKAGSKGLSRTVWLSANGSNVVYANTIISVDDTDAKLLSNLRISTEALGNIAANSKLPVRRDNLEIGTVSAAEINEGFNLPSDKKLLGRRSRMFILDENNKSVLNASIIEVFHSDIIPL